MLWMIVRKELLELLRDRRTLIFTILLPTLIMPVLMGAYAYFTISLMKEAQEEVLSYAVFGEQHAPALAKRFADAKDFKRVELRDPAAIKAAIVDERIKFALVIPANYGERLTQREPIALDLHYNAAQVSAALLTARVSEQVNAQRDTLRAQVLGNLGLSSAQQAFALEPLKLNKVSTADERESTGEKIGALLPYFLLIVCLTGAMYPAIDLGAGEKERGTLETLLLAPVARGQLVLAKFLVLFCTGMTAALLSVTSLVVAAIGLGQAFAISMLAKLGATFGGPQLLMVVLMLVPVSAIFAAALLALSIYAKSFKEAQSYMSPMMMMVMIPIGMTMVPGITLNWKWAMVPISNVALAMKELLKGTLDFTMLSVIMASTIVLAGALLLFCRWWFSREEVLFRS